MPSAVLRFPSFAALALVSAVGLALSASLTAQAILTAAPIDVPPAPAPVVVPRPLPTYESHPVPDRWSGKGELSYVATGGNTDTNTAKLAGEIQFKPARWALLARAAFLNSTTETGDRNQRVDGLLRASRGLTSRIDAFAQIVYLENTFAGISSSFYPLAGLSYDVFTSPTHVLTARVGLGYGQESRVLTPDRTFPTADSEIAYRWRLSKTAEFQQDTTFTTNMSRGRDWRAGSVTALTAALNALLSLKVSHVASYLNAPVEGFGGLDTVSSAAIVATF